MERFPIGTVGDCARQTRCTATAAAVVAVMCTAGMAQSQWLSAPQSYAIQRVGLFGVPQTGTGGIQFSEVLAQNGIGQAIGYSSRFTSSGASNGQNAWLWNGATTRQIGLTGTDHTRADGFQFAGGLFQNNSGLVAGYSNRYRQGLATGTSAWVWDGATTREIGLSGGLFSSEGIYQNGRPQVVTSAHLVAGYADRYTPAGSLNGQNAWGWNGSATTQIGLNGPAYTGSNGYQFSSVQTANTTGPLVVGYSTRIAGVQQSVGRDVWVWNGNSTIQVGFFGPGYITSTGRQESEVTTQSGSGQVGGYSARFESGGRQTGTDAWVWNGTTTIRVGLLGAAQTSESGFQFSSPTLQNAAGHVVGYSARYVGQETYLGQDSWLWDGSTTRQVGLTGPGYLSSSGYQYSTPRYMSASGVVAGYSERYIGLQPSGRDAWAWNGSQTVQIGLSGGAYTGTAGYQLSNPELINASGQIAGFSRRVSGVSDYAGNDAWLWVNGTTRQIGLSGGVFSGSNGLQESIPLMQNQVGQVVGSSNRIAGLNTSIGRTAWYFDPATLLTTAITGSVRTIDNYAYSQPTLLTEDGFVLGYYQFFAGGVNPSVDRAFIFRPDLGFTDLGNLVSGGLTASGWMTLQRPQFTDALRSIVGYGYVNGQTSGQSVFAMTIPSPSAAAVVLLAGLSCSRRRRA